MQQWDISLHFINEACHKIQQAFYQETITKPDDVWILHGMMLWCSHDIDYVHLNMLHSLWLWSSLVLLLTTILARAGVVGLCRVRLLQRLHASSKWSPQHKFQGEQCQELSGRFRTGGLCCEREIPHSAMCEWGLAFLPQTNFLSGFTECPE